MTTGKLAVRGPRALGALAFRHVALKARGRPEQSSSAGLEEQDPPYSVKEQQTTEYPANGSSILPRRAGLAFRPAAMKKRIMVKPHGSLVPVSLTHRCASTPGLSTWSSTRSLQRDLLPGRSHLVEGFTLRCLQRFSLPDVATRHCRWRDNRYTRGPSNPVLSY